MKWLDLSFVVLYAGAAADSAVMYLAPIIVCADEEGKIHHLISLS